MRDALPSIGDDSALSAARRQVCYRAAAIIDAEPRLLRGAADVLRSTIADLLAGKPPADDGADQLDAIFATFAPRRGARRHADP